MTETVTVYADGGCHPNPGSKYGSFESVLDGRTLVRRMWVEFGQGTNNEAEFNVLEFALQETLSRLRENAISAAALELVVFTDSRILQKRVNGDNRIFKKPKWHDASCRMFELANKVIVLCKEFKSYSCKWEPRENNVARFGH